MSSYATITVDLTGPTITSLTIEGGAAETADTSVDVVIVTSATDVASVVFYGDVAGVTGGLEANATPVTFNGTGVAHTITLTSGDGVKTVNAKLIDDVDNRGAQASDTINLNTAAPTPDVSAVSRTKVSQRAGKNTSTLTWAVPETFDEYQLRVVPTTGSDHTTGTALGTANGSTNVAGSAGYPASTNINSVIDVDDLLAASAGEGAKIVKVFVRQGAIWSSI